MSLMWKLLTTGLLLSSVAYAQNTSGTIEEFLEDQFLGNPRVDDVKVHVEEVVPLKEVKGWSGYIIDLRATLKNKEKSVVEQKMIWFSNGKVITKDLVSLDSGKNLQEEIKPQFKEKYYRDENLVYGNKNAKHRVVIFSDPLCPFCKGFVPGALENMKKEPNKFAVYYYHLPLLRLHPASGTLVKAAMAAKQSGLKDILLPLYTVKVNSHEKDPQKILDAFNKAEGTHLTLKDINSDAVKAGIKSDLQVSRDLMVAGTPTVYLDGKIDATKKKYLKVQ